jgi:NadR type nicotinamide-nucleotide adenylyltransferase
MGRSTGLVLGRFRPPTLGHCYVVDFGRRYVDHLTVVVGSLRQEAIPGDLRHRWMRELFPDAEVLHLTDENPQHPEDHPDFWRIWHDSLRRLLPTGPDFVFASEDYGVTLARVLGATYIPVDHERRLVPVSGSAVRNDPMRYWRYLPVPVRPYFVRRVCIIGPESTGKSTLAARLARRFDTVVVGEYARALIDRHAGAVTESLFPAIVRGQRASEEALARQANRVLVCDSDAFTTLLYRQLYVGDCPADIREAADRARYDLYLVTSPDTPYVSDPQRHHPEQRGWFFDRCVEWVRSRSARHVILRGSWDERFDRACAAIEELVDPLTSSPATGPVP